MFSLHYCWVSCLFLETKMLYNFDSQAANVSHCDSEPINVERIQTGCVRLSQPCPWSRSCDQSAAEHTSGSYQKKHPRPCRPAAAGSPVLQHRSTRMIHTFATTPTRQHVKLISKVVPAVQNSLKGYSISLQYRLVSLFQNLNYFCVV